MANDGIGGRIEPNKTLDSRHSSNSVKAGGQSAANVQQKKTAFKIMVHNGKIRFDSTIIPFKRNT